MLRSPVLFALLASTSISATTALYYNFVTNSFFGATQTFTRSTTAMVEDETGKWVSSPVNTLRRAYTPKTPRINDVPNSTGQGAKVGTLGAGATGAPPTGWSSPTGVNSSIVFVGKIDGIDVVGYRFQGVPSTTVGQVVQFQPAITLLNGTIRTTSVYAAIVAGDLTNVSPVELRAGSEGGATYPTLTSQLTRITNTRVMSSTSAGMATFRWNYLNTTTPVDFTIYFGLPQGEVGVTVASDPIKTYGVAGIADAERTNLVTNTTFPNPVLGVVGSGGSLGSGQFQILSTGLFNEVTGFGVEDGMEYIDVRTYGTPTIAGPAASIYFNPSVFSGASIGQTWVGSLSRKLIAGSMSGIVHTSLVVDERTAGNSFLSATTNVLPAPQPGELIRSAGLRHVTGATAGLVGFYHRIGCTINVPIDITIRYAAPQMERSVYMSEFIRTTGTSLTIPRGSIAARGAILEDNRTNHIRNNAAVGAVLGSPGTMPSPWVFTVPAGLTRTIIATGTTDGMDWIELGLSGTVTTAGAAIIYTDGSTGAVPASNSQSWINSVFLQVIQTDPGVSVLYNALMQKDASNVNLSGVSPIVAQTPIWTRYSNAFTTNNASIVTLMPYITTNTIAVGVTITNWRVRIGWPQLENAATVSSPIRTTGASAGRGNDNLTFTVPGTVSHGIVTLEDGTKSVISTPPGSYTHPRYTQAIKSLELTTGFPFYSDAVVDYDFVRNRYLGPTLTTTRASTGWVEDSLGNWKEIPANQPRISDKGILIEESRTNVVRNNSNQGGVAGSPGTLPTYLGFATPTGLTRTVSFGSTNGIEWVQFDFVGTAGNTSPFNFYPDGSTGVHTAASPGQTWIHSAWVQLIQNNGNTAVTTFNLGILERNSGGAQVQYNTSPNPSPLEWGRRTHSRTMSDATTTAVASYIGTSTAVPAGTYVDVSFRIGWDQLENAQFASSPIRTTGVAATRAADIVKGTFGSALTAATLAGIGTPHSPASTNNNQSLVAISDNSVTNRIFLGRHNGGGAAMVHITPPDSNIAVGAIAQNARFAAATAAESGSRSISVNGSAVVTGTLASFPTAMNTVQIGNSGSGGSSFWNGYIERILVTPTKRVDANVISAATIDNWKY